jgi:hypothetical protein
MKKLFLFFLFNFFLFGSAQNYQPVYSNTESFYYSSADNIIYGIKPDSFVVAAGDTVFHHYRCAFDTSFYNYYCAGLILDYPTWQGTKTIVKQNGDAVFFNKKNDSIFFKNGSATSWILFAFPNGDKIIAKVDSIGYLNLNTFSDSVKVIELQVQDSLGNVIQNKINGKKIIVSRSKGWFTSLNWLEFPADSTTWVIEPAHRLTVGDIYDYEVGDIFENMRSWNCSCPSIVRYHIISKSIYGPDSVVYEAATVHKYWPTCSAPWTPQYNYDTVKLKYVKLDSLLYSTMPEQTIYDSTNINLNHGYQMSMYGLQECRRYKIGFVSANTYYYSQDSLCYAYVFEGVGGEISYVAGLGQLERYDNCSQGGTCCLYTESFNYYYESQTGLSCGFENITTSLKEDSYSALYFFPNPAQTELTIFLTKNLTSFSIYDLSGKDIPARIISSENGRTKIDVSSLQDGLYFLRIVENGYESTSRFIKSN